MPRIKPTFAYFGSKGRFYKEIKEIFEENYRENFVDLFAGSMEIPLNFKNEFGELKVLANVKDEKIECLLSGNAIDTYKKGLKYIKHDLNINARNLYEDDKAAFEEVNKRFKNIFSKFCPCCGKKLSTRVKHEVFNENEKRILRSLMGFGGNGTTLSSAFYSEKKIKKLELYIEALKTIKVTTDLFDENWQFENSFIFLDPPYICKTNVGEEGLIGYNYVDDEGVDWTIKDDERLVEFIKRNQNKNNVFLIFGSVDNNLSKLLKENFKCKFIIKEYKKQMFGKLADKAEYFCLIK